MWGSAWRAVEQRYRQVHIDGTERRLFQLVHFETYDQLSLDPLGKEASTPVSCS